jgi:predicted nucleic acid-binding protein
MMLGDTSAIIALIDTSNGADHVRCQKIASEFRGPLVVNWAVITETMYFAGKRGGWRMQELFGSALVNREATLIHIPQEPEVTRVRELMEAYADTPMDLADATIVAAAETLGINQVFTLDSHFRIYRTRDGGTFEILPE